MDTFPVFLRFVALNSTGTVCFLKSVLILLTHRNSFFLNHLHFLPLLFFSDILHYIFSKEQSIWKKNFVITYHIHYPSPPITFPARSKLHFFSVSQAHLYRYFTWCSSLFPEFSSPICQYKLFWKIIGKHHIKIQPSNSNWYIII